MTAGPQGGESAAAGLVLQDEPRLIEALRRGDEDAFVALVEQYQSSMLRLAVLYVRDRGSAEEVVQETWLGVLRGLDRFEGRSSLRTWIFHILVNRAKTRAERAGRLIPFSMLWNADAEPPEPAVDPDRFLPADHPQWPGHWASPPRDWGESPEKRLLSNEVHALVQQVVDMLPHSQQEVITLRDIEGWSSGEVCELLDISETNQRVLLHRARSKVRRVLEQYLDEGR